MLIGFSPPVVYPGRDETSQLNILLQTGVEYLHTPTAVQEEVAV